MISWGKLRCTEEADVIKENSKKKKLLIIVTGVYLLATVINVIAIRARLSHVYSEPERLVLQSSQISFSEFNFDMTDRIELQDLHTGEYSTVNDQGRIRDIVRFLKGIEADDRMSARGYYGAMYTVAMYSSGSEVFSVSFGDGNDIFFEENYEESFLEGKSRYRNRYSLVGTTKDDVIDAFSGYFSDDL